MPDDATNSGEPVEATEPAESAAPAEPAESAEAAPALTDQAGQLLARLQAELGDVIVEHAAAYGDVVVRVRPDAWRATAQFCKERLECDYLSFVAGIDWMPAPVIAEEGSGDTSSPAQPARADVRHRRQRGPLPGVRVRRVDAVTRTGARCSRPTSPRPTCGPNLGSPVYPGRRLARA